MIFAYCIDLKTKSNVPFEESFLRENILMKSLYENQSRIFQFVLVY